MQRDGWKCRECQSETKTLNVHHTRYLNRHAPWEYPPDLLITLCEDCHSETHGLKSKAEENEKAAWEPEYVGQLYQSRNNNEREIEEMENFLRDICLLPNNYYACIQSIFYDSNASLCTFEWKPLADLLREDEWDKLKEVACRHINQFVWIDGKVYGNGCVVL